MTIDHVGIRVRDLGRSKAFYLQALAPLGYAIRIDEDFGVGLGDTPKPDLWLYPGEPPDDGAHIALAAADRASVDAFHVAALTAGATDRDGPRSHPEYHAGYYGAFVTDPDGYNLEAVVHQW